MSVDLNKLKLLRQQTSVSFALCKKALEETNNDLNEAKKKLSQWAGRKIEEKSTRPTAAGAIFAYVHHNKKVAGFVTLLSETDFVSGNEQFQKLGTELAMQLASMPSQKIEDFLNQEYIRDPSIKVADLIKEAVLKFGENIKIGKMERWTL